MRCVNSSTENGLHKAIHRDNNVRTLPRRRIASSVPLLVFVIRRTRRERVSQKTENASFNTIDWDQLLYKQSGCARTMLRIFFFPVRRCHTWAQTPRRLAPLFCFWGATEAPKLERDKAESSQPEVGLSVRSRRQSIDFVNKRKALARTEVEWAMRQDNWNNFR